MIPVDWPSPDTIEIVEQTIIEAVEVAQKEDIRFGDNFVKLCLRYLKKGGDHFPSLAVDFLNKRETEIDYFNGKIVEYGRKHYVRTPLNLTFTNLIKAASSKNKEVNKHQKVDPEVIKQANIDQNRRNAIRGITSSLVTLLVTVPVYLYHWKMVRKIAR